MIDVTFYAQLVPTWVSDYCKRRGDAPDGARVERITQAKPTKPIGGGITTKLTVRLDPKMFMPLQPEAIVVLPESLALGTPIVVEALDPND